jgi:5-methylcytosine-specific restriction endonuclease McrA
MRERFFSSDQRREHDELVGHQCEGYIEKGMRCTEEYIEADHLVPYSKGGETETDNMLWLGKICHAIKHFLDGETGSARLIKKRMSEDEKEELRNRGFFF